MSDLISRSALIKELKEWADSNAIKYYDTAYDVIQDCMSTVENQPTAYDVEKVVEELEKATKYITLNGKNTDVKAMHPVQVIKIVKRGGIDG